MTFLKKLIAAAITVCLVATLIPLTISAQDPPKTYLALGDSISAGYGLDSIDDAFATILAAKLSKTHSNKAVSGDTTTMLLGHLKTQEYKNAIAAADVITITIGGNDLLAFLYQFLANSLGMDMAEVTKALENGDQAILVQAAKAINEGDFSPTEADHAVIAENHVAIITEIKSINPTATIVVATQYNPYEKLAAQISEIPSFLLSGDLKTLADAIVKLSSSVESSVITFNAGVKSRAETYSYIVADTYTAFKATAENLSNASMTLSPFSVGLDFHPNKAGHAVIADCIYSVLTPPCDHSASASKPTCESSAVCTICKSTIAALGHTEVVIPAVAPSCTETGLEEGIKCSVCDTVLTEQKVINALGHIGGSATCAGLAKCERCDAEYGELDPDHSKYMTEEVFFDDNEHWHVCLCGQKHLVGAHVLNDSGVCTGCRYQKAPDTAATSEETTVTEVDTSEIKTDPPVEPTTEITVETEVPSATGSSTAPTIDLKELGCLGSSGGAAAVIVALCSILGVAIVRKK